MDIIHLIAAYPQIPQWAVSVISAAVNAATVVSILGGLGLGAIAGVYIKRYGLRLGITM
ncbi:MAG: hypothetical protein LBS28_01945 [Streptococcaceae bacterium]|nr:hypothetical protein [Streptococcaceae bacterium]